MKIYHYLPKFFLCNSTKEHSKLATPIFPKESCCFSSFQLAQQVFVRTHWVMSALLYMCRLICACVTAIYLMWLVWGFLVFQKVATIRLKRPYISAEYIFECNIFPPVFQLKNENNVSGSGSLYFVAPLQFYNTNTFVPFQCKAVLVSLNIPKSTDIVFVAAHGRLES